MGVAAGGAGSGQALRATTFADEGRRTLYSSTTPRPPRGACSSLPGRPAAPYAEKVRRFRPSPSVSARTSWASARRARAAVALGASLVTTVLGASLLATGAGASDSIGVPLLVDEARSLKPAERVTLETRLAEAQAAIDSPVIVHIVKDVGGGGVASEALRRFNERKLADLGKNPVLLLFATNRRTGALETGKGLAGIVPEVEARALLRRLETRWTQRGPLAALDRAVDDIVESAQETAARRQPLPASDGPADSGGAAPAMPAAEAPAEVRRSKLPLAILAAVAILLALGLRRRAQLKAAAERSASAARDRSATKAFEADRTSRLREAFARPPRTTTTRTTTTTAPGEAPVAPPVTAVDEDEPTKPRRAETATNKIVAATSPPEAASAVPEDDRRLPPPPPAPRRRR